MVDESRRRSGWHRKGLWWPVMLRRRQRWLVLTIVIDDGPSMALRRSRIAAFVMLVEEAVRSCSFECGGCSPTA